MTAPTRIRSPKTATNTGIQRRERAEAMPLPQLGRLAGTARLHDFVAIATTPGQPQCRECFGWTDDVRHPVAIGRVGR